MTNEQIGTKNQPSHDVSHFEKLLGVGTNYTPEYVLNCFDITYQVKEENDELDNFEIYIEAKNLLLQSLVSGQMKDRRYFEIVAPFENTCSVCKGTGETYKFERKSVLVNCHICGGTKYVKTEIECEKCHGSGRFVSKFKGGGGINVSCLKCGGAKKETVKNICLECEGTGKIRKAVIDHNIKSTTPCKHCKQLGFTKNKPKKQFHKKEIKPANPVLTASLAEKIKGNISSDGNVV